MFQWSLSHTNKKENDDAHDTHDAHNTDNDDSGDRNCANSNGAILQNIQ